MKSSLSILSVTVISMLTLTGCPGGGGSSNNAPVGVGQLNAGSCNIQPNYYTCTQTLNGVVLNTSSISYLNQQDLCAKINDNYSQTNKDARGQVVATEWRQNYFSTSCQGVVLPTNPTNPVGALKTFTCQLQAKKGGVMFASEPQNFYMLATGGRVELFANSFRSKTTGRWFKFTRYYSVKLANIIVEYSAALPAHPASMDQLKMSVTDIDGNISASVKGYAGAENKISITPQNTDDDQTELFASCSSSDAKAMGLATSTGKYQCKGTERANGKTRVIDFVNQISDVVTSGISITDSVFVQGEQDGFGGGVTFAQTLPSYNDSTVSLTSNLTSATSIVIKKSNYSLDVKCQPK